MTALMELRGACRCYGSGAARVQALDHVDLDIAAASSIAIMGASGSGKSTLLNILGGLDRLDGGSYRVDGRDISKFGDNKLSAMRLRRFGFVFQGFHLIPQLNVLENIELPLYYRGVDNVTARRRALRLAGRFGLENRIHHLPAQLSGGQQQRVAIARALANEPDILFADEPTGNLDSASGAQVLDVLQQLVQEGKTLVLVTHDEAVAAAMQRLVRMCDGRVVS